jgi:hypothetical protein
MNGSDPMNCSPLRLVVFAQAIVVLSGCGDGAVIYHCDGRIVNERREAVEGARVAILPLLSNRNHPPTTWPAEWFAQQSTLTDVSGRFEGTAVLFPYGPAIPHFSAPRIRAVDLFLESSGKQHTIKNIPLQPDQPAIKGIHQLHIPPTTMPANSD